MMIVTGILFFALLLHAINRYLGKYNCPSCGYEFEWGERRRLFRYGGLERRTVPCPNCQASLAWKKWPLIVTELGSVLFLIYLMMQVTGHDQMINDKTSGLCIKIILSLQVVGLFNLRLIEVNRKKVEPEPAPPPYSSPTAGSESGEA